MKKVGHEFKLLSPGAEKALLPIWFAIAEKLNHPGSTCDTVFWTTDSSSGYLAVRLIDSTDENAADRNVLTYSTPHIGQASQVLESILGDRYSDETLRPFQSIYETWVDHVLRVSFDDPKVQSAFRPILNSRALFRIVATSVDEGLTGELRVISQGKSQKTKPASNLAANRKKSTKKR